MLVVAGAVVQAANDKEQIVPMLDALAQLPAELGKPATMLADNGYFSQANVEACVTAKITPLIALGRDRHNVACRSVAPKHPRLQTIRRRSSRWRIGSPRPRGDTSDIGGQGRR